MNKNRKLWVGVISLTLAVLFFAILLIIQKSMNQEPDYELVLRAKTDIPSNVLLTDANLDIYVEKQRVPVMWLPEGYLSEQEVLAGKVVTVPASKGSILTKSMVREHQDYYDGYSELIWISVPIEELYEGVAGSIRAGDYVDIYVLTEKDEEYFCDLLTEKVRVEYTYDDQGTAVEKGGSEGLTQLMVIPMERALVPDFYEYLARGSIRVAKYEQG